MCLQRRHALTPPGEDSVAALEVSERARARALLDSLLDARVDLREGIEPALLDRERSLQKQLNDASSAVSRLFGSKGRDEGARGSGAEGRSPDGGVPAAAGADSPRESALCRGDAAAAVVGARDPAVRPR